jgi:D-alanine-D-alanine ligase
MVKARSKSRIVVIYNRDFEGADSDPENKAREDVKDIARDIRFILEGNGYVAEEFGVSNDVTDAFEKIRSFTPDAVFNLCESIHGDNRFECLMPMLLDLANIPFTGSGAFALALALRKEKVKEILQGKGITTPWGSVVTSVAECELLAPTFPLIVKPAREDASVGISCQSVVNDRKALLARVGFVLEHYKQPVLVEEFIAGREIYVSLLGQPDGTNQIFPFYEIDFSELPQGLPQIVSFEGKWIEDSPEYHGTKPIPCDSLSSELEELITRTAREVFHTVGLRDYGRVDIRLSLAGIPYVIDVNPNCDLSNLAGGFSRAAKAAGLTYPELILHIINLALERQTDRIQSKF